VTRAFSLLLSSKACRAACALSALAAALALWVRLGPLPDGFLDPAPHRSVRVLDRRGRLLYESLSGREARSAWLKPGEVPELLEKATLAAEDRRFYRHPGIDPLALARAAWADLKAGAVAEGGSTLTQQAVKQLMGGRAGLRGKLRETLYALRLEHRLNKREILALYLNLAPYGNQYTGARAASLGYFGCEPSSLTAAQAAFLAGLPQRPTRYDPYRHFDRARNRQRQVLGRMRRLGMIGPEDCARARQERLVLLRPARPCEARHFVERALQTSRGASGEIRTTLDLDLQRQVEGVLAARRAELLRHGAHNAAVVVLDNATGGWLAWEGSGDYFDADHSGAVDGAVSPRQPGSALKPFTYALAFERGFTPASALPDVPAHFPTAEKGVVYSPRNYDGVFRGPLRARMALAGSENVPAVWLLSQVGVPPLLALLKDVGLTTLDRTADYYGFGLTLGDTEVRLDELTAAYAALARGGVAISPKVLAGAEGGDVQGRRVLSARTAFWVTDILSDNRARAFVFGRGGSLEFPFPVAAKTGTSQAYRDNWTLGFTREVTVGVWAGNFDGTPLKGASGVTGAGPVFHDVLLAAERAALGRLPLASDPPILEAPRELVPVSLCALSGMKASEACPAPVTEMLPADALPPVCRWHVGGRSGSTVAWPAEYQSWARGRGLAGGATIAPEDPARSSSRERAQAALAIESPPDGATYWIDPTLRAEYQRLEFRARTTSSGEVRWLLDGKPVASLPPSQPCRWEPAPGRHSLEAEDSSGRRARAEFTVKR
jgi:penicillin-binding protein 1C